MKFFKQTKETKRKISFFMALAMVISLLPVSPVAKAASDTKTATDCNVYIVNECSKYVTVSDTLTGTAIKKGAGTTSAVIKVKANDSYKISAVSSSSVDITETGKELGGLTINDSAGKVVTGVSITVKKVTSNPGNISTSCAVSASSINKVSIKEAKENNATYAAITVDGVKEGDVEITLSYKKTTEEETKNPTVSFNVGGLSGAKITAKSVYDKKGVALDTSKTTPVTSGSIVSLTITPEGNNKFKNGPVVKKNSATTVDVKAEGTSYVSGDITIDGTTTITVTGTAEPEDSPVSKYSVDLSGNITNADVVAEFGGKTFNSGKIGDLTAKDTVTITVTPKTGYFYNETVQPLIEASGATTKGALATGDSGSYIATVTGFTKATTIKVSGEPVKSSLGIDNSNKDTNIGKAELEVSTATLEKNKDKLIAAFGTASKSAIEAILNNGGKLSVALEVKSGKMSDDDKKAINDAKLGVSDADLAKGVVLDIKLIASCYNASNQLVDSVGVTSLTEELTIKMSIEELIKEALKTGYTRSYYIIRVHDGRADKLPCTIDEEDKNIISFKSGLFSTYVLMYEDKKDNQDVDDDKSNGPFSPYVPSGPSGTSTPAPSATPSATPDASATPSASVEPSTTPSASPSDTDGIAPGASSKPDATKAPAGNDKDDNTGGSTVKVKVGKKVTVNSSKYKVTSVSGTRAVQFTSSKKNAKNVVIPATVKISGKNYKVTSIANNAFKNNKKLKKVTIGVNVNKIGKAAFKGCKNLKSIIIKTKKLTAKKVGANAFKGINKKATFKVPKKKVKAYKKIVKAKGAAKTVKVKK